MTPWQPIRAAVITQWALRDLVHERGLSLLMVLLVLCLITPAMVVVMARAAVIDGWTAMLETDARNRSVIIVGERDVTPELLADIASWRETGFVVPEPSAFVGSTRFLPAQGQPQRLDTWTSAPGDPVLGALAAPDDDSVVLTAAAAVRLGAQPGDVLRVTLRREPVAAPVEFVEIPLLLTGVIPDTQWSGDIAFLSPARTAGIDRWTINPGNPHPPLLMPDEPSRWRSIRIYAPVVAEAPALRDRLEQSGFETRLNTDQVLRMATMSDGLQALATSMVALCAVGFAVAVFLLQRLAVLRKAETLALMSVAGMSRRDMTLFLLVQAAVVTLAGVALAGMAMIPLRTLVERLSEALVPGVPPADTNVVLILIGGLAATVIALCFTLVAARGIAYLDFPQLLRND